MARMEATNNDEVRVLRKSDMQVDWLALPGTQDRGYLRGLHTSLAGTNYRARLVALPEGQGSPPHSCDAEHIIVILTGRVAFDAAGRRYEIGQHDMLFIPADVDYSYVNAGTDQALFLAITGKVAGWPPTNTYKFPGAKDELVHVPPA